MGIPIPRTLSFYWNGHLWIMIWQLFLRFEILTILIRGKTISKLQSPLSQSLSKVHLAFHSHHAAKFNTKIIVSPVWEFLWWRTEAKIIIRWMDGLTLKELIFLLQNEFLILNMFSLWPSDAIRWQRSGSTLAQVMACCLMAPSHYLNQCWLIISEVQWHSY